MSSVTPPGQSPTVDSTHQSYVFKETFSIDQIILMVDMQTEASQGEMKMYMAQQKEALNVKKGINAALAHLAQAGGGEINDASLHKNLVSALKDAQAATHDPELKARFDEAIALADKGGDDRITKDEIASIHDTLTGVSSDLDGEQQAVMLGLQAAVDRMKRITELGSNWLAKLDETANVAIRNMHGG